MNSNVTASSVIASNDLPPPAAPSRSATEGAWPFAIVAALGVLADWLFFGRPPGISIVLFLAAVLIGFAAANRRQIRVEALPHAAAVFCVSVFPLIVELSFPALIFAVLGTAYFVIAVTQESATWKVHAADILALLFQIAWRIVPDVLMIKQNWAVSARATSGAGATAVWLVPIVLGMVFVLLFANANPLIAYLFLRIDVQALFAYISVPRILFWLLAVVIVWPFIFFVRNTVENIVRSAVQTIANEIGPVPLPGTLFGPAAILRSLIVFNILFAVQTGLDAIYLWGRVALPTGMSYASYAHRGAYPLIVTALLAAAFVIAAMRPGSAMEKSPLIRALVFIWVGQNVLLVGSALLRLDLYVDTYSLTYWRLSAGIWMALVAIGLVLIAVRILLGRSNAWLVNMNLASLALTLYLCCLLNFPAIIATYNLAHNGGFTGTRSALDWCYLRSLGPHIIPSVDAYLRSQLDDSKAGDSRGFEFWRQEQAQKHLSHMQDWRAWTYRDHQLASYLRSNPRGSVGR